MADILQEIIAHKSVEIESRKAALPYSALEKQLGDILDTPCPSMQQALMSSQSGVIAEFKRKSPSK
jgi:indole-3-glycerol phosphate synthase